MVLRKRFCARGFPAGKLGQKDLNKVLGKLGKRLDDKGEIRGWMLER